MWGRGCSFYIFINLGVGQYEFNGVDVIKWEKKWGKGVGSVESR